IVTVTAAVGEPNDELTQIVITGLQSDWEYDFNGLNQPGVQSLTVDLGTGTVTIIFNGSANVQNYTGTFSVQPPPNSDVDHPPLIATVTAADQADPSVQATGNFTLNIDVDAVADTPTVDITVEDGGDPGSTFQTDETGTVTVTATFGDEKDGSEIHTVTSTVPDGFTVSNISDGGVVDAAAKTVTWTVPSDGSAVGTFEATYDVKDVSAAEGTPEFTAAAKADENPPTDHECNTDNNIATADATTSATVVNV